MCEKVCIPKNGYTSSENRYVAFGAKNKILNERKQSQSGGAFYVIAKYVLSCNGAVYGASLNADFTVRHARACTEEQIQNFRGSKYVQSDLGDTFKNVKEDLDNDKLVLFSGTPCQVAGLRSFLQKRFDNLILVDLVCHGVPSPKIWADYLCWQQSRIKNKKISRAEFRDKSLPWGSNFEALWLNGKKRRYGIYSRIFYSRNAYRKSCYTCHFANIKRLSDITIGDFWGVENVKKKFADKHGVSLMIVNSDVGMRVFNQIRGELDIFECTLDDLLPGNPNLSKPSFRPSSRGAFWKDYKKGFEFVAHKYGDWNFKGRVKTLIKLVLRM